MTKAEIQDFIDKFEKNTEIITRSKESCQEYLIRLGANNRDGSLTPEYRQNN
jgi:hypothetical protein